MDKLGSLNPSGMQQLLLESFLLLILTMKRLEKNFSPMKAKKT